MIQWKRRVVVVIIAAVLGLLADTARAQVAVIDPANIAQAIELVRKAVLEYNKLRDQYETILLMSQALPNMGRYRTVPIAFAAHDAARWTYGAPWVTALNTGDPRGELYAQTARTMLPTAGALAGLPPEARRAIEDAIATIEVTDSVAQRGAHQAALVRTYGGVIQSVVQVLESDILNPAGRFHRLTTVLDKIAAGELIGRRQDTASNQLISHALEQQLVQSKRKRDTEVATMNMRLTAMQQGRAFSRSYIEGSADALRTWRQP